MIYVIYLYFIFKDINSYEIQIRTLEEELERLRREVRKYKRLSKEKVNLSKLSNRVERFLKKIRISLNLCQSKLIWNNMQ